MILVAWVGFGQYFFLSVIPSCLMTEWLLGRVYYSYCIGIVMSLYCVCAGGTRTFPLLVFCDADGPEQHEWTLKHELCLEEDFFGSPTVTKNSYYLLPVMPLCKSCCRGI